jgi:hypothetical protein
VEPTPSTKPRAPALLWLIALTSLAMNIVVCGLLAAVVSAARGAAVSAAAELEALGNSTFTTQVKIDQRVAVNTSVPFRYASEIPFKQTIPINTVVPIRQDIPLLGEVRFDAPINTTVPIDLKVPISVSQDIAINTTVPIQLDVPVSISVRDTPVKAQIDRIVQLLRQIGN